MEPTKYLLLLFLSLPLIISCTKDKAPEMMDPIVIDTAGTSVVIDRSGDYFGTMTGSGQWVAFGDTGVIHYSLDTAFETYITVKNVGSDSISFTTKALSGLSQIHIISLTYIFDYDSSEYYKIEGSGGNSQGSVTFQFVGDTLKHHDSFSWIYGGISTNFVGLK